MTEHKTNHCPQLSKEEWHQTKHVWNKQLFYKVHYSCFLNLPINLQKKVRASLTMLRNRNLLDDKPMIFSARENSWGGDLLISIKEPAPDLETRAISGNFISFLFNGSYAEVPRWVEGVRKYGQQEHRNFEELYIWHVTCPRCSKKYGTSQTVIFAKIV
ncbi:hydrolase [Patescibacteria group bacterium]